MSNPITGDFEGVLQVSGGTVNRLMATMHQNADAAPGLPRFPHSLWLRIGDDRALESVRGTLQAQIGVPLINLIHGVMDRFQLEVGVRARYKPDPGTSPLPEFIHGTVRAEYRIRDIDPSCLGWGRAGTNYLWVRVVRESVRFQGTAENDANPFLQSVSEPAPNPAAMEAKITRQIARLLATRFAARPHPVSKHFKRGSMRTLNAPIGGSAVAMPLGLSGEPVGQINSIDNLILDNADCAIGITRDYIMGLAEPALAGIRSYNPTIGIHVHVDTPRPFPDVDISTVYRVSVDPPTVEWQPHGNFAVIKIKFSGSAKTDSVLPNATFDVDQDIVLNFDAGGEVLWLSRGSGNVRAHSDGVGSNIVADNVSKAVGKAVQSRVDAACSQAQPTLDAMIGRKQELIDQLRTLDPNADAYFNQAVFVRDGIILRGVIPLSSRVAPVGNYDKTLEQDGFTALESWIPGGRVDKIEWSWTWAGGDPPGKANYEDRFVLRRPAGIRGRWGVGVALRQPLPGLDGNGSVCVKIRGVRVDSVTGLLVPVESLSRCRRYGLNPSVFTRTGRLFLRDVPELSQDVPFPQLAVIAMEAADRVTASNTLLIYLERGWNDEIASTLRSGLETTRRDNAGLSMLVLFREGVLESAGSQQARPIQELGVRLGIATMVNEDVRGSWAKAYDLHRGSEYSWRLLSPAGGATWAHEGRVSTAELASAFDHGLFPSPPARPAPIRVGTTVGLQVVATALYPGILDTLDDFASECPPITLGTLGVGEAVVAFVQRDSMASHAQLRTLAARYSQRERGPAVVVVVDGAGAHETERMKHELGIDFATIPDPQGTIANRFAVRVWPTTITLDHAGFISAVDIGHAVRRDPCADRKYEGGEL
jgi:hypothetical protein